MTSQDHSPRQAASQRAPALAGRDLLVIVRLPLMTMIAWGVPPRLWLRVCRPWARLTIRLHRARSTQQRQRLRTLFGPRWFHDVDRLAAAIVENHHLTTLQLLRCYRLGGWRPHIDFAGREHVTRALDAGKGAILWVSPSCSSTLVTKMAFAQQGFQVSHLSRRAHGFSGSRIGARVLNPIWTSVEERYLAERLVMSAEESAGALRALVRRVRANQLVSITVAALGQRTYAVPVLSGALCVADGAPVLAYRTGAALLPVFSVCTGDDTFATVVEPPLTAAAHLDRHNAVQALFAGYAAVLERYLVRWPEQFAGFESMTLPLVAGMRSPQPWPRR
jgi:lauroyl/myristoyl acyltransferase